jgi:hypothetical protein
MDADEPWLRRNYSFHSYWKSRSSAYALAMLVRNDVPIPRLRSHEQ